MTLCAKAKKRLNAVVISMFSQRIHMSTKNIQLFSKRGQILTKNGIRALALLAWNPGKSFSVREVSKELGISPGSASTMLNRLKSKGLVTTEVRGRLLLCSIDLENPIARQLKVLLSLDTLGDLVGSLKPFAKKIILFGSAARGLDTEESDIDVFVLTTDMAKAKEAISQARNSISRKLSPVIVDTTGYSRLKREDKPFYDSINSGITLWDSNGL